MSRRLHLAPVLVMLVIAVVQASVAGPSRLSPWKGGGFGMFATTDHARIVDVDGMPIDDRAAANQASEVRLRHVATEHGEPAVVFRPEFDPDSNILTWREIARWP